MSAQIVKSRAKDHRPKVISFRTTLHGLSIAAREDVLWPCHAFNISIPQKKKSGLNVFEETVLKITEIESGDTYRIADIACLFDSDKDGKVITDQNGKKQTALVSFIQNRLYQLGLLSNRYELSEQGRELLNGWQNKSDENLEYTVATVFVDLLSGKLLPYVSTDQLSYKKISKIADNGFIDFLINPTNEKSRVSARQIRPAIDSFWKTVPDTNNIIRAIREFKKKYKRNALLSQSVDQYPPPVPMAEAISVNDNPELVFLHCKALIQIGNSDLLVTDGGGFGFSESFANYLTSQNFSWVTNLKQKGVIDKIGNAEGSVDQFSRKSVKYAEISNRIVESKSALQKIKNLEVNSTYYERHYKQKIEKGIKKLYAALEWALRQIVADNPVSEWELIFSSGNFRDNEKLLTEFAKKVGFTVNEKNRNLLQVKPGALRQIEHGKVELQPLLALSIAGANSSANHPLHRLALNHTGFLNHALRLKKYRDPIEHGSTEELDIDEGTLEELIKTIVPMIISLVPGIACDVGEIDKTTSESDINQEGLKANIELEKALGAAFLSSLIVDIKKQLVRSEEMLAKYTDDKAIEVINCYYSVVQHALLDAIKDRRLEVESDFIRDDAVEKIIQAGFFSQANKIPQDITTVAPHRVKLAVQGSSQSVGANLLAVFLLGSETELIQLRNSDPAIVDFVANLARLRGHANKQQSDFSRDDMESLKNNVFKAIKIITEVF